MTTTTIKPKKVPLAITLTLCSITMLAGVISPQVIKADDTKAAGAVAFSFIGQVNNQAPNGVGNTSTQFGYLDGISSLDSVFTSSDPLLQNEHSAMFTFNVDAVTVRKKLNGQISIGNREGSLTIYQINDPSVTNFSMPETFRLGVPVLTASLTQQVIADLTTGGFYVTNTLNVTNAEPFFVDGHQHLLAEVGQQFRSTYSGRSNTILGSTGPSGFFAGFAVRVGKSGD